MPEEPGSAFLGQKGVALGYAIAAPHHPVQPLDQGRVGDHAPEWFTVGRQQIPQIAHARTVSLTLQALGVALLHESGLWR
jgi:hypothetical protein